MKSHDEFTTASRNLTNSSDALAGLVGEIKFDTYIQSSNKDAKITEQEGPVCWAHACASVIHLSLQRIVGREKLDFKKIRNHLLSVFESVGQNTGAVLDKICSSYKLHSKEIDEVGARAAIYARRPVVATFSLDDNRCNEFSRFFKSNPKNTLTANDMTASVGGDRDGHPVVLIRCDDTSLTFMNSWGADFANNGFFSVDKASTLEIENGPRMRLFDVYWTLADLSAGEITAWEKYQSEKVSGVIGSLPKSFHQLPVSCPRCKNTAEACDYEGSWNEARCKACHGTFTPTVQALVRSLYESNYDAV